MSSDAQDWVFPKTGTNALRRYIERDVSVLRLFHLIADATMAADHMPAELEALIEGKEIGSVGTAADLAKTKPGPRIKALRKRRQDLLEAMVARLVDNFQCYVVDLLRETFVKDRRVLTSSTPSLSLEYTLRFASIDDLFADVIDRKVNDLSYKGFDDVQKWCIERGIPFALDDDVRTDIVLFTAVRNIIAHNRGVVDKKFLALVPKSKAPLGQTYQLDIKDYFAAQDRLGRAAATIDQQVREKFALAIVDTLPPDAPPDSAKK